MCHVLKHASKRLHDPREVVAESLRCRKSGQFGGSSFRHVPLIAMVKEIVHPPDAFFRPFAQEQVKILIRPHSYPSRVFIAFRAALLSDSARALVEGSPMLHLPIMTFKVVDNPAARTKPCSIKLPWPWRFPVWSRDASWDGSECLLSAAIRC